MKASVKIETALVQLNKEDVDWILDVLKAFNGKGETLIKFTGPDSASLKLGELIRDLNEIRTYIYYCIDIISSHCQCEANAVDSSNSISVIGGGIYRTLERGLEVGKCESSSIFTFEIKREGKTDTYNILNAGVLIRNLREVDKRVGSFICRISELI